MILRKSIFKMAILTIAVFSLTSCIDDVTDIGGGMVDNSNYDARVYKNVALSAHSTKIDRVQSNGLNSYALGVYEDGIYGHTSANVLAQLTLSFLNPSFGNEPIVDSVVLEVPYFSRIISQEGFKRKYELDSVFGKDKMELSVYRSNYFMRNFDPFDDFDSQAYYTDDLEKFENNLSGAPIYSTTHLEPSDKEIVIVEQIAGTENIDTVRKTPRLRVHLPKDYFENAIIAKEGSDELRTQENFKDYFRGLYFKTAQVDNSGFMALLDFNNNSAGVYIYYKVERKQDDDEEPGPIRYDRKEFKLEFKGLKANVYDTDYQSLPAVDNNLYVKGGQGSMAIIDLFTDEEQLDSIRSAGWLINEANLKFYLNKDEIPEGHINPERLLIYDVKNGKLLKDYTVSAGINDNNPANSRLVHLGPLEKDSLGNSFYKIRMTNYINDVLTKDSTNTKLGLVVAQNVNVSQMAKGSVSQPDTDDVKRIPFAEVLARNGTVLHGPEAPEGKRLKLELYYTKHR